mgnify:CR=1 FL=1
MTAVIKRPGIDAWRERWESDPAITYRAVAESSGFTIATVRGYAVRSGWYRSPEVHAAMLKRAATAGLVSRYGNGFLTRGAPDPSRIAIPSVWDLGTGRRVTTDRQHEEVYA